MKRVLCYVLAVFFVLGGLNHFINPAFYLKMMPDYIPAHGTMVMLSGVTEIIAGVMLAVPATRRWGAWFVFAHLAVFFTVHIWMLQRAHDRFKDLPVVGLWIRLAVQFVLLAWAFWYTKPDESITSDAHM